MAEDILLSISEKSYILPSYEAEQKLLKEVVVMLRNEIETQDDKTANVRALFVKNLFFPNHGNFRIFS